MAVVFGASGSPNRVPYSDRLVRFIANQLNGTIKYAYENAAHATTREDVDSLKIIIRIFTKKSGMNDKILPGKALKEEVSTRLGSLCDTVERFIVASADVVSVINCSDQEAAKTANEAFDSIKFDNSSHPSLKVSRRLTLLSL